MSKQKMIYECSECGYESMRWMGKCPDCGEWNTLIEKQIVLSSKTDDSQDQILSTAEPILLKDVKDEIDGRTLTGIGELDRVLGGGITKGSVMLFAGDPGIGKSTLLLQVLSKLSNEEFKTLYVTGEESNYQIKARAKRLNILNNKLLVLSDTYIENIIKHIDKNEPDFIVIDSIQTMHKQSHSSSPGSVPQIRECASMLIKHAKSTGSSIFLVGHVTKEGTLAGPKVLEHMVDVVMYFEGDKQHEYRLLRTAKNRYGSVNELGVFQMSEQGMEEVENPSETLISNRAKNVSGSIVFCALQGTRPILVDIQGLSTTSFYPVPKRTVNGLDYSRISMILAILEKRAGKKLYNQDVFLNVAGGISLDDPAADLAIAMAIVSSLENKSINNKLTVMGEIGLSGEIRAISQPQRRINECERLGYDIIILPKSIRNKVKGKSSTKLLFVENIVQAFSLLDLLNKEDDSIER
ncbi:MAG: DNA repair protein RadA [Christensenellaceae bacterium]|nr:DNA repair protein RadA [Christensenellaceae bacterium]